MEITINFIGKINSELKKVEDCPLQENAHLPAIGVFATRSPDRPNPIGLHSVKVVSIESGNIKVSGLEVLDQTPVIDIKPDLKRSR